NGSRRMRMDCKTLALVVERYLANDLPAMVRADAEAHLSVCAACRARVRDFAQIHVFLHDMPREAVSPRLQLGVRREIRARLLRQRLGHALPFAVATLLSAAMFVWLASETFLALQERALWEFIRWLVSVPELLWPHPGDMLAAFVDFAPVGGVVFTLGAAISSWLLGL